jgi:hypothetical protein
MCYFVGLKMTISMPVVDTSTNSSLIGTAAVDVSMATMFTEIEDFILGVHSYAFLIEKRHGEYNTLRVGYPHHTYELE